MPQPAAENLGTLRSGQTLMRFVCELEPCAREAASNEPPQWIHVMPLGPQVEARDGRKFTVKDAQQVVRATELPMLIDWEHASEHGDTRAAGWIEELRIEPAEAGSKAGVWGRAHWTPQGREHVSTRHFRFLSPVVVGKRDVNPGKSFMEFHVEKLTSVALTNRPALRMHGIEAFREQLSQRLGPFEQEPDKMNDDTRRALCAAFGLAPDANDEAIASAVKPVIESAQATASLREACTKLTEDLNAARADAQKIAAQLEQYRGQSFQRDVQAFLDEGARVGKIPPAARAKWSEFCLASSANFQTFKEVIYPGLATIGGRAPSAPKEGTSAGSKAFSARSRNGVDRMALKRMGFTEEQILDAEADVFDPQRKKAQRSDEREADAEDDDDGAEDADGEDGDDDGNDDAAAQQTPLQGG